MARSSAIHSESFEEILSWLNPDRDVAGAVYVQLRQDLGKIFSWNGCSDPEGMVDEVFDRVAMKVHEIKPNYEGDPRLYFLAVGKRLIFENLKKTKTHVSLEDVVLVQPQVAEDETEENIQRVLEVLEQCIDELSPTDRHLFLSYYQVKKRDARKLAADLAISEINLRVRIHRIRQSLKRKIERKMKT